MTRRKKKAETPLTEESQTPAATPIPPERTGKPEKLSPAQRIGRSLHRWNFSGEVDLKELGPLVHISNEPATLAALGCMLKVTEFLSKPPPINGWEEANSAMNLMLKLTRYAHEINTGLSKPVDDVKTTVNLNVDVNEKTDPKEVARVMREITDNIMKQYTPIDPRTKQPIIELKHQQAEVGKSDGVKSDTKATVVRRTTRMVRIKPPANK